MTFLSRRRRATAPVVDLAPLEFDDHTRTLVRLSAHIPKAIRDPSAAGGMDVECSCGRVLYLGHMVRHIVDWIREARQETLDRLLHRVGQADVVAVFGRDDVATTLRVLRAVTGRSES